MKKEHLFALCWLTYVTAYLCRVNFSSAMEKLSSGLHISLAQLGFIGSCFFFCYAVGQIINGFLGDRIMPSFFISIAITLTGLLNLFMAGSSGYLSMIFIWSANGYIQSMLWGPIMRILSARFRSDERVKISIGMSSSMVAGFILSWTVLGRGFLKLSWNWYFAVPSLIALLFGAIWIYRSLKTDRSDKPAAPAAPSSSSSASHVSHTLAAVFFPDRIWLIALSCFCLGAIKESVSLWAPTLIARMLCIDGKNSLFLAAVIPLFNMTGILASGTLIQIFHGSSKKSLITFFLLALVSSVLLFGYYDRNPYLSVFLIAIVSGIMYGCNTILLSYIPISFCAFHLVSTLVGIFDFMSYMGASISSFCLGTMISSGSFRSIFMFWIVTSGFAALFVFHFRLPDKYE